MNSVRENVATASGGSWRLRGVWLWAAVVTVLFAAGFTSCGEKVKTPSGRQQTMLIYMVAQNDMDRWGVVDDNIDNLLRGLPSNMGNNQILIYIDRNAKPPFLLKIDNSKRDTVRIKTYSEANSATKARFSEVLSDVKRLFSARKYSLDMWSHGSGWIPADKTSYYGSPAAGLLKAAPASGAAASSGSPRELMFQTSRWFGTESGLHMDITDISDAIRENDMHFHFILFDACLMGGIEVAYELRDCADYLILSPAEVLMAGFPYHKITAPIFQSTPNLAKVCREYYDYYINVGFPYATVSLIKCSELDALATKTAEILSSPAALMSDINSAAMQTFDMKFSGHIFYDLKQIVNEVASPSDTMEFRQILDRVVIRKYTTPSFETNEGRFLINSANYSGLTVYLPSSTVHTDLNTPHRNTSWGIDTGWGAVY